MGKKYIIELEDNPHIFGDNKLWRVKGFASLVFDEFGVSKLRPTDGLRQFEYGRGVSDTLKKMKDFIHKYIMAPRRKSVEDESDLKQFDIVNDPSNNLCIITNTDTSIHVVYPNGKTCKWEKRDADKFEKLTEQ